MKKKLTMLAALLCVACGAHVSYAQRAVTGEFVMYIGETSYHKLLKYASKHNSQEDSLRDYTWKDYVASSGRGYTIHYNGRQFIMEGLSYGTSLIEDSTGAITGENLFMIYFEGDQVKLSVGRPSHYANMENVQKAQADVKELISKTKLL